MVLRMTRARRIVRRSERVRWWKVIGAKRVTKSERKNKRKIGMKRKTYTNDGEMGEGMSVCAKENFYYTLHCVVVGYYIVSYVRRLYGRKLGGEGKNNILNARRRGKL